MQRTFSSAARRAASSRTSSNIINTISIATHSARRLFAAVAVFDFDDTLAVSKRGSAEFSLRFSHVVEVMDGLAERIVIVSNESLGSYKNPETLNKYLSSKCSKISKFCGLLSKPVLVLLPTGKDRDRKGYGPGCWELLRGLGVRFDPKLSCMVGDADGRRGQDVSCNADRIFARDGAVRFISERDFFVTKVRKEKGEALEKGGTDDDDAKLVVEHLGRRLRWETMMVEVKR